MPFMMMPSEQDLLPGGGPEVRYETAEDEHGEDVSERGVSEEQAVPDADLPEAQGGVE